MSLRTTCGKLAPISSPSSNSSLQRCIMNDRVLQIDDGDNSSVVGNVYQTLAEHSGPNPGTIAIFSPSYNSGRSGLMSSLNSAFLNWPFKSTASVPRRSDISVSATSFGLLIDRRGVTDYVLESPFMDLRRDNGIEVPTEADCDEPDDQGRRIVRRAASRPNRLAGNSKLKKWSCGCTNVRCAVELRAWCCRCGKPFVQAL